MSTITVKDGTTIFRTVSLRHIRIWSVVCCLVPTSSPVRRVMAETMSLVTAQRWRG